MNALLQHERATGQNNGGNVELWFRGAALLSVVVVVLAEGRVVG